MNSGGARQSSRRWIDGIPVVWVEPDGGASGRPLAVWLPWFTGAKEACVPVLEDLAAAGFVAVSLDPWQHGKRGSESGDDLATRVFGGFRRYMWPILGQTTLDALRLVDWAISTLGVNEELVAGGVSMGGDIALALAGIDGRVSRVAAIVATPDWSRPGMHDLNDPSKVVDQGEADSYAQWFYDRLNPMTHLDAFARGPAIAVECGADDTHVPADGADRFLIALKAAHPSAAARMRVTRHAGLGHLEAAQDPAVLRDALAWLTDNRT